MYAAPFKKWYTSSFTEEIIIIIRRNNSFFSKTLIIRFLQNLFKQSKKKKEKEQDGIVDITTQVKKGKFDGFIFNAINCFHIIKFLFVELTSFKIYCNG